MKKYLLALLFAAVGMSAHAATYAYPTINTTQSYTVVGAFSDNVDITVPAYGTYTVSLVPTNRTVACSGRGCRSKGSILTTITGAQLQTVGGTAMADVSYTASVYLTPGDYVLHVSGTGAGTGAYLGQGGYSLTVQGTVPVQVLDCEWYDTRNLPRAPGCLNP